MYLTRLDVQGIRNISSVSLSPIEGVNILFGANGSGKTSLLEAIYLLGRGRTFRSRFAKNLISHQARQCTVFGELSTTHPPAVHTIGVSRERTGSFQFKVNGHRVSTASSLADAMPLLVMNSQSFHLIEGGASGRRRFLDWGVFHVEQQFKLLWGQFQRSLQQRNKLLRHDKISVNELSSWDESFTRISLQLTELRKQYFERISPLFVNLIGRLSALPNVSLEFYPGWNDKVEFNTGLKQSYGRDSMRGTTHIGPHKADIRITVDGVAARDVLSRGQIKSLVAALIVGQGNMFQELTNKQCIYLFDDIVSELDNEYLTRLMTVLQRAKSQVFITGTDCLPITNVLEKEKFKNFAVFHVEQGKINSQKVSDLKGEAQ